MKDEPPAAPSEQESIPLRWLGASLFFRAFAYGLLYAACVLINIPRLVPFLRGVVGFLFPLLLITSPLWVPFSAGIVGAYFWPHPEEKTYVRANWLCAWLFLVVGMVMLLVAGFGLAICCAPFSVFIDVIASIYGGDAGRKFWNGRLGRQFLGDFSTDDWNDDGK